MSQSPPPKKGSPWSESASAPTGAVAPPDGELIQYSVRGRVVTGVIDAPPMQVMTPALYRELRALAAHLAAAGPELGVLVLRSADPDVFIAHFDVEALLRIPTPTGHDGAGPSPADIGPFRTMCEQIRTSPVVSIVEIDGRIGGGGAELAANVDLRFGSLERFVLNQMEVPLGILPGGTGTQRLPRLVGQGRAMEIVLGAVDIDGPTAEQWGWLNRALPSDELSAHVDQLADRIAAHPPHAVRAAKQAVLAAGVDPVPGLLEEARLFDQTMAHPDARTRMRAFLEAGGQTKAGEAQMEALTAGLGEPGRQDQVSPDQASPEPGA